MFAQGDIVKSKLRTEDFPYFLMVLEDPTPSTIQFKGVVIFCKSSSRWLDPEETPGYVTDTWNTSNWEKSDFKEITQIIQNDAIKSVCPNCNHVNTGNYDNLNHCFVCDHEWFR